MIGVEAARGAESYHLSPVTYHALFRFLQVCNHGIEKASCLAAGHHPVIEGERERQHAPHRGLVVNHHHVFRDPPGAEDGDECVCIVEKVGEIRNRVRLK